MTNLYWSVYKDLEKELLELSFNVHFDDTQFEYIINENNNKGYIKTPTYSLKIGNLLIRCCTEIEALVQGLTKDCDDEIKNMPTYDKKKGITIGCRSTYLERLWHLDKKVIQVSCSNMFFQKKENKIITPFKYSKNDNDDFISAYNSIKHNRNLETIRKGNIRFLLRAMAALYLLNVYYKNLTIKAGDGYLNIIKNGTHEGTLDDNPTFSVGSELFLASAFSPPMPWYPTKKTAVAVDNEYVYCKRMTETSYATSIFAIKKKERELKNQFPNEDFDNIENDVYKKLHSYTFQIFSGGSYEFIVNKGQIIYDEIAY